MQEANPTSGLAGHEPDLTVLLLRTSKNSLVAFLADHGFVPRPDGRYQLGLDGPIRRDGDDVPNAVHAVDAAPALSA
jgi:hypothetical protein